MPPKGVTTRMSPMRLQTVQTLRIKRPNKHDQNPCVAVMSSVLNCWSSSGYTVEGCMQLEQQLRACMDEQKGHRSKKSTINYHLMRMFPKLSGPRRRSGSLG